jgi:hypothetical protein
MGPSGELKKKESDMQRIRSVGVMSCAKLFGISYACIGLLFIPFAVLGGLASMISQQSHGAISSAVFVFLGLLAPFFYGAIGFIFGALWAWIYNLVAGWVGGIEIDLQTGGASVASVPQI